VFDAAGAMYWGNVHNTGPDKIETAYLNGTGRRTLSTETAGSYVNFALHDGIIYFTGGTYEYACLFYICNVAERRMRVCLLSDMRIMK